MPGIDLVIREIASEILRIFLNKTDFAMVTTVAACQSKIRRKGATVSVLLFWKQKKLNRYYAVIHFNM